MIKHSLENKDPFRISNSFLTTILAATCKPGHVVRHRADCQKCFMDYFQRIITVSAKAFQVFAEKTAYEFMRRDGILYFSPCHLNS